jgi:hypothetical protein
LYKLFLGEWNFKVVQIKGQVIFKGEIITKNVKMGKGYLEIFSRTTWPILIKLGTDHP